MDHPVGKEQFQQDMRTLSLKLELKRKMDMNEITDEHLEWFLSLSKEERDQLIKK